ncbi:MAG: 5'-nucleotidase C-terminal domain-containing protein [Planctomycetes bacterium]|nr:5'-nucleotidase C-terminal domain-containing protein [Planctomycetota bacterium]
MPIPWKRLPRPLALPVLLLALFGLVGCPGTGHPTDLSRIVLLHTNDLHGQVLPLRLAARGDAPARTVGGFSALSRYALDARAEAERNGRAFLLVDAGDFFQGTPEGDLPKGRFVLELLNHMRYDLLTVGNHEFDKGPENVASLAGAASFPFLGANVRLADDPAHGPAWLKPYVLKNAGGVRIAFVGLLTSEMPILTTAAARKGLTFPREEEVLAELLPRLESTEHPDLIVLVTHCGFERDKELAARFPRLRLILGGHSHTGVEKTFTHPATGCVIGQNFSSSRSLDRVEIFWDRAKHLPASITTQLVTLDAQQASTDSEADALIARYAPEIEAAMGASVGVLETDLVRESNGAVSSPLGNVLTDAMREAAGTDVAFHNRAGIRANLLAGELHEREMYQVSPFGNTLVTMKLSAKDLRAVLEHSLSSGPRYFLEVSGLECDYDPSKPEGERVLAVRVGGAALAEDAAVTAVTNSFVAQGGDGHAIFAAQKDARDTGLQLLDAQREYFRKRSPFKPEFKNRALPVAAGK